MSSFGRSFALDAALVATVSQLHSRDAALLPATMAAAMAHLLSSSTSSSSVYGGDDAAVVEAVATLYWEVSKVPPRVSTAAIADLLHQAGLSAAVVDAFVTTLHAHVDDVRALKRGFAPHLPTYQDMAWRLDVEVARRNAHALAEPVYMVRLDLAAAPSSVPSPSPSSSSSDGPTDVVSMHMQADHANMRRLQDELQKASDALRSAHCQRLTRYIS
jgi:hypothetical protein